MAAFCSVWTGSLQILFGELAWRRGLCWAVSRAPSGGCSGRSASALSLQVPSGRCPPLTCLLPLFFGWKNRAPSLCCWFLCCTCSCVLGCRGGGCGFLAAPCSPRRGVAGAKLLQPVAPADLCQAGREWRPDLCLPVMQQTGNLVQLRPLVSQQIHCGFLSLCWRRIRLSPVVVKGIRSFGVERGLFSEKPWCFLAR